MKEEGSGREDILRNVFFTVRAWARFGSERRLSRQHGLPEFLCACSGE